MCVAVIKLALRIAFATVLMPFRIFSATVLRAGNTVLYLTWGHHQIDTTVAQRGLSAKETPAAPITHPTQGGGGYGVRGGRIITEMTGNGGGALTTGGEYTLQTSSGSGFLNVGYLVKRGSYFRVYPLVGFGGSSARATISSDPGSAVDDAGRFVQPVVVGTGGPLVNVGLGLELKLGSRFGVMAGIRFGFVFSPFGAGKAAMLTPYAHFIGGMGAFGGGRKRRKK